MKYLKRFNEHNGVKVGGIDILDQKWENMLPKILKIITDNGEFELGRKEGLNDMGHITDITHLQDNIQIIYSQNTLDKNPNPTADGEPDTLEIDLWIMKDNNGKVADPKIPKLNVDISYGDSMVSTFTIEHPKNVGVVHYTGKHSKYDPDTFFAFQDDSLKELVEFFNKFGYELSVSDFKFLDKDPDSYQYKDPKIKGNNKDIKSMSGADGKDIEHLKGGDHVNKVFHTKDTTPKSFVNYGKDSKK